jgi:hypothetical protein
MVLAKRGIPVGEVVEGWGYGEEEMGECPVKPVLDTV